MHARGYAEAERALTRGRNHPRRQAQVYEGLGPAACRMPSPAVTFGNRAASTPLGRNDGISAVFERLAGFTTQKVAICVALVHARAVLHRSNL